MRGFLNLLVREFMRIFVPINAQYYDIMDWKDMLADKFKDELKDLPAETSVEDATAEEPQPSRQTLRIELDKRGRSGKRATLITGFEGSDDALKTLAKELKLHCGVGGSARCSEILIQGDVRQKVQQFLSEKGYKTKLIG